MGLSRDAGFTHQYSTFSNLGVGYYGVLLVGQYNGGGTAESLIMLVKDICLQSVHF